MATIRLLCLLLGFGSLMGGAGLRRDLLAEVARARIIQVAQSQLGVREATGHNDGLAVEAYLHYTHLGKGNPWCAAFISWIYGQAGFARPCSAWSPDLFPRERSTLQPQRGDVFGIYFASKKRIAHAGIVMTTRKDWLQTVEGNTNGAGSREGDGVYVKWRHRRQLHAYADWITERRGL